ncbi:MAG: hypothetical protein AYK18_09575 [Theionarchaea archaeon DG-70]|nr:MAG: hypothetical protein AYK18_09575 [Theionarchaea archaeon DG-70]
MFKREHEGKLYDLKEEDGKFAAVLRFNYKKDTMRNVLEGDFVACENFFSSEEKKYYTLMKITSIFPRHYALEAIKGGGYPTFLREVVRNIVEDWDTDTSTETFVLATASPVGYDLVNREQKVDFQRGMSKPMPGEDVGILDRNTTREFLSWGIGREKIEIGKFRRDPELEVFVNLRKMLRRHFGVFGSTGTGKSNFLAQLIRTILQYDNSIKIILFDIQGEYLALLADVLYDCGVILLNEDEITDNLRRFLISAERAENMDQSNETIAIELSRTSKKPGKYEDNPDPFVPYFRRLLEQNRIRILQPSDELTFRYIQEFISYLGDQIGTSANKRNFFRAFCREIRRRGIREEFTERNVLEIREIAQELSHREDFLTGKGQLNTHVNQLFSIIEHLLEDIEQSFTPVAGDSTTPIESVVHDFIINERGERLCLISISEEIEIRRALSRIAEGAIYRRKRNPTFSHDVLFVFDEAHEYAPARGTEEAKQEGVDQSRKALMKLSRQGRKYGLGMCLATQRTTYMDTIIMGQVHTFFAGFLPRKEDRERIGEAFNVDEATLIEVQEFAPGEWLLSSAVATGLTNVPIALKAKDSEEILEEFFKKQGFITQETGGGT